MDEDNELYNLAHLALRVLAAQQEYFKGGRTKRAMVNSMDLERELKLKAQAIVHREIGKQESLLDEGKPLCCPRCGEQGRLATVDTVLCMITVDGRGMGQWAGETDLDTQESQRDKDGRYLLCCRNCVHEWWAAVDIS